MRLACFVAALLGAVLFGAAFDIAVTERRGGVVFLGTLLIVVVVLAIASQVLR